MGKLEKIYLKRGKLGPMDEALQAEIQSGKGIVGNLEQNIFRQITIMEKEVWEALMNDFQVDLSLKTRRANLIISGLNLENSKKKILVIGNCEIGIFGETKPCARMDQAEQGLQKAMIQWKGGAFGKALTDGNINIGDKVYFKEL